MRPVRIPAAALAVVLAFVGMIPGTSLAAKPGGGSATTDITATARGRLLATETADRFTAEGDPTSASDLKAYLYADGSVLVARSDAGNLATSTTSSGGAYAAMDVGAGLPSADSNGATAQSVTAAAAAYWELRETACLASLYVQSARLDSCYYIYKEINDGSTTRSYWTLRQKGSAFEYEAGLFTAWVSGERTPNTVAQTWVDWEPDQGHSGDVGQCSSMNLGVSHIATVSYTTTACEQWFYDKSCNTCSPWLKSTWDCDCYYLRFGGLSTPPTPVSRAIAYQMVVSVGQSQTPSFRLGLGLGA